MKAASIRNQIEVLRARVESELATPAVLVVTSAKKGDGKSLIAHGLADSFTEARYRVLLVDANSANPEMPDLPQPTRLEAGFEDAAYPIRRVGAFEALSLADPKIASGTPREAVEAAASWMRSNYDVVIVDAAPITSSTLALLFASCADATLLTLKMGRKASDDDTAAIAALERISARVLGVVTTTREASRQFAKRTREELRPATPTLRPARLPRVDTVSEERTVSGRGRVSAEAS